MNISKRKQGILAIICTIAMIVTSITVYNPREVKADPSATVDGKQYSATVKDSGEWTGFACQGIFDNARIHFAWGIAVDAATITASLNGNQLKVAGQNANGMYIPLTEVTNLEVGSYDIVVTATTVATKTAEAKEVSATATLKIEVPEETTTRDPSVEVWKNIVGGTGYSYNDNTTVKVVSVQQPEFASEQGIYMTVPGAIESISINGVDSKKYALQGGGAVVYLSGLVKGENTINIKYAGGEATVIIKNENEVETPNLETDERTGNIVQGKIWKAYTRAEDSKGLYEISSDATNYTLKDKNIGSDWWHIQTAIDGVTFYANTDYVCTFTLKADKPKEFTVDNRTNDGKIFVESEGKGWQKAEDGTYFYKYKGTFASTAKQDLNVRIALGYHNGKDKKTDSKYSADEVATFKMSNFQIVKASEYKAVTYTVSIDGTEETYEEGDSISVPADGQGYYDVTKKVAYAPGSVLTVNENMTLKSIELNVAMESGAGIKLTTPTGLRFKTNVTGTTDILSQSDIIKTGTIITASDILDGGTVDDNFVKSNKLKLNIENNGWYGNTVGTFCASIVELQEANYARDFVGVGYVTIKYNNNAEKTIYAPSGTVRAVATVAQNIKNSKAIYQNGMTYYNYLKSLNKGYDTIIETYAAATKNNQ
ncbi:MAG: hypothetical protein V8R99_02175 [Eubacterium ventriosum]|uniref:hypothetical protein n=1 Tax=Eubacterium ventriosum TaxID=39496 RepID=UPI00300E8BE6